MRTKAELIEDGTQDAPNYQLPTTASDRQETTVRTSEHIITPESRNDCAAQRQSRLLIWRDHPMDVLRPSRRCLDSLDMPFRSVLTNPDDARSRRTRQSQATI